MPDLLIIDSDTVKKLLTMPLCIDAMEAAAIAVSNQGITAPQRRAMALHDRSGVLMLMPGSSVAPPVYGAKMISLHEGNPQRGLPAIQGYVSLFDHHTGAPLAIIEGAALTGIRTAAASGMATRLLARKNARSHGVFGAGVQARTHIEAVIAARPSIKETLIWARNYGKAQALAEELTQELGINISVTPEPQMAAACDIVTTVTAANAPVVLGKWLKPGTHMNVVGGHLASVREVDTEAVLASSVYVETVETAFAEAGELIIPQQEGVFAQTDVAGEIGDVASGKKAARVSEGQITLYKSLGNVSQDLYAAWAVYNQAKDKNFGVSVPF